MPLDLYIAFLAASAILLTIPGPTVMLVVSYALAGGRRTAWSTVPGVGLGDFTAMTLSFAGMGALLAASATAFTVVKWIGAAYLVWLGIKMWRAPAALPHAMQVGETRSSRTMFLHAWIVTALNPKGIVFFVAFVPQFLTPGHPVLPQLLIMGATFLTLAVGNVALYALAAGTARQAIRRPSLLRTLNRLGGSLLIGAGLATAALRRVG